MISILPMFPQKSKFLISVLLATRGRPEGLKRAIKSIEDNTVGQQSVEIILKIDDDDTTTISVANSIHSSCKIPMRAIVGARGRGYGDMHTYTNAMASVAEGDWLFMFNDDAEITTKGWDRNLLGLLLPSIWHYCPQDIIALTAKTNGVTESNEAFFVRRKVFQILGYLSPIPYLDSWLYQVLIPLQGVIRFSDIEMKHHVDPNDATRKETTSYTDHGFAILEGITPVLGQLSDTLKLMYYMQNKLNSADVLDAPAQSGWYYWQQKHNSQPFHIFVGEENEMWPIKVNGGLWRLREEV